MISSHNKHFSSRRLCADAAFACAALAFAYLEVLVPVSAVIPLPGVKLGLANLAVMMAFFALSPTDAAMVAIVRVLVSALLFGSPVSFFFSLLGGAAAYLTMFLSRIAVRNGIMSFIGASVISSAAHGCGQVLAASLIYTPSAVLYLPILLISGAVFGVLVGILLNVLYVRTERTVHGKSI